jgi:hypothetical protein
MMHFAAFLSAFLGACRNLVPIVLVVAALQILLVGEIPDRIFQVAGGLLLVAIGIALFLQGLELSVFPVGRSLSDAFLTKGSLPWLLVFGFCLGFAAVIAEPSLIAVASKAEQVSAGRIDAGILRVVAAASVGIAIALGILRTVLDHRIHWYLIGGYLLLILVTHLTPTEITGIAMDAGAVSVNLVTVPLIMSLGIGLTVSLRGRSVLSEGFGILALAVLAPRMTVQLYGLFVYAFEPEVLSTQAAVTGIPSLEEPLLETPADARMSPLQRLGSDMVGLARNLVPMLMVILVFHLLVLRRALPRPRRLAVGFGLLLLGLLAFIEGLHLGLFPIGSHMALTLGRTEHLGYVLLFVFLLGASATLVEPALIAAVQRAAQLDAARVRPLLIRGLVALGVGLGLALGVLRIMVGWPLESVLLWTVLALLFFTLAAPSELVAFAFDLGGIATSDVNVPVITALGVGLVAAFGHRELVMDAFGLVALASLFPILVILLYAIVFERLPACMTKSI